MLIVAFDDKAGHVVPDGRAAQFVEQVLADYVAGGLPRVSVGSGLLVSVFRLTVAQGRIAHDELAFEFEGELLHPGPSGVIQHWPHGFADLDHLLARDLVHAQVAHFKKVQAERKEKLSAVCAKS